MLLDGSASTAADEPRPGTCSSLHRLFSASGRLPLLQAQRIGSSRPNDRFPRRHRPKCNRGLTGKLLRRSPDRTSGSPGRSAGPATTGLRAWKAWRRRRCPTGSRSCSPTMESNSPTAKEPSRTARPPVPRPILDRVYREHAESNIEDQAPIIRTQWASRADEPDDQTRPCKRYHYESNGQLSSAI